jgi:hypothetical protein
MTDELVRALAVATRYRKLYDDSNPDVGMGPCLIDHIIYILNVVMMPTTTANIQEIKDTYKQKWKD